MVPSIHLECSFSFPLSWIHGTWLYILFSSFVLVFPLFSVLMCLFETIKKGKAPQTLCQTLGRQEKAAARVFRQSNVGCHLPMKIGQPWSASAGKRVVGGAGLHRCSCAHLPRSGHELFQCKQGHSNQKGLLVKFSIDSVLDPLLLLYSVSG